MAYIGDCGEFGDVNWELHDDWNYWKVQGSKFHRESLICQIFFHLHRLYCKPQRYLTGCQPTDVSFEFKQWRNVIVKGKK